MPTTYVNSINSNPIYADRAEKDASGNVITTTYATKAEIPSDELPAKSASDAGKALVVNSAGTGVEWSSVGGGSTYTFDAPLYEDSGSVRLLIGTAGLVVGVDPESGSDALLVNFDNNTIVENDGALEVANPLPTADASDAGKALVAGSDGTPAWTALSIPTIGTVSI